MSLFTLSSYLVYLLSFGLFTLFLKLCFGALFINHHLTLLIYALFLLVIDPLLTLAIMARVRYFKNITN